jgi:hypothetical protein
MDRSGRPKRLRLSRPTGRRERLFAAFMFGAALFSPPLLNVASHDLFVLGVPLLVLWLFGGWLLLIVIMALIIEGREKDGS